MAIKLISALFGHAVGVIVRDVSYDVEARLVAEGSATYTLTGGTEQTKPTLPANATAADSAFLQGRLPAQTENTTSGNSTGAGVGVPLLRDTLTGAIIDAFNTVVGVVANISIAPSGDITGVKDYAARAAAAAVAATMVTGCAVEYAPGDYYDKRLQGGETRFATTGSTWFCRVPQGAKFHRVDDGLVGGQPNWSNQIELNGVSNVTLDGLFFDGNRTASAALQGIPNTDAIANGIRVVNANNVRILRCGSNSQPFHGLIGVGSMDRILIDDFVGAWNGYRSLHLHSETNGYARRITVNNVTSYGNGAHPYHAWSGSATTTAGNAVVQLNTAGDAAKFQDLITYGNNLAFFIMPGAGTNGDQLVCTVTSADTGNNRITLSQVVPTALTGPARGIGELASGIFLTYGPGRYSYTNIYSFNEPGYGIQLSGSRDTLLNKLVSGNGSVFAATKNKLRLTPTAYATFKAAWNGLSGANQALVRVNIDTAGGDGMSHVSAVSAITDAEFSLTLTTPAIAEVFNADVIAGYPVANGGTFTEAAGEINMANIIVDNCGMGALFENVFAEVTNMRITNSAIHGAWVKSGRVQWKSSTIRNSGVCPLYIAAIDADSNGHSFHGVISEAGASINMTAAANRRLTNTVFEPGTVIEKLGFNATFRTITANMLGGKYGCAFVAHNDNGNGYVQAPRCYGVEIARNWGGIASLVAAPDGVFNGCMIYDNVDPSSTPGNGAGKGSPGLVTLGDCGDLEISFNNFNDRLLVNESYLLDVSNGATKARVIFNVMQKLDRNNGGTGAVLCYGNATTRHYGNEFKSTLTAPWNAAATLVAIPNL